MRSSSALKRSFSGVIAMLMAIILVTACLVKPINAQADKSDNFDVYIYAVDKILEDNQFNFYKNEYETLCEVWKESLPNSFHYAENAWVATNLILSPGDALDKTIDARGYYVAVILEMLQSTYKLDTVISKIDSSGTVKGATKAYTDFVDFFDKRNLETYEELLAKTSLSADDKKIMLDSYKEWLESDDLDVGHAMNDIFKILEAANTAQECAEMFASYCMIAEMGEDWKQCLQYMYNNCDKSNTAMYYALKDMVEVASSDSWANIIFNAWQYSIEQNIATAYKYGVDAFVEGMVGSIPFIKGMQIGQAIGSGVSNAFFGTDKILESYYVVEAYCELLEMFHEAFDNAVSIYKANKTPENAKNVLAYVDMYFTMLDTGGVLGREFADAIHTGGFANTFMTSKEEYDTICKKNDNILRMTKEAHKSITLRWIADLYHDDSEMYEVYATILNAKYSDFECLVTRVEFENESVEWGVDDWLFTGYDCNVYPEAADCKSLAYSSSDESVAYISENGYAVVKGVGTCVITATSLDSSDIYDTLQVTVVDGHGADSMSYDQLTQPVPVEPETEFFTYTVANNTATITGYSGYFANLTIPGEIDGYTVTGIGGKSFSGSSIYSVVIPETVTTIGESAFQDCSSLTSITIPENVTTIGYYAFKNCDKLTEIILKNKVLGYGMFEDCDKLISITIPENITSIAGGPFSHCDGLKEINFENNILGTWMFHDCTGITTITIPANIKYIDGNYTFYECINLKEINIENSIICDSMFRDCDNLEIVNLSNEVVKIGGYAFRDCSSLASITIPESVTSIGTSAFSGCSNLTIYGYKGSYAETYAANNSIPFVALSILKITSQPVDYEGKIGDTATFTVTAAGENLTYQWEQNAGNGWVVMNSSVARKASFSVQITEARAAYQYRCVISDGTNSVTSDAVKMIVKESLAITEQPVDYTGKIGEMATFTIGATGVKYYQWQQDTGSGWVSINTVSARKPSFSVAIAAFRLGYKYRCVISDGSSIIASDIVQMKLAETLEITTQPVDYVGNIGDTAKFTVEATGATSYQWYQNTGSGWVEMNTTAGRSNTISIAVAQFRVGFQYKCEVSDGTNTLTSNIVSIKLDEVLGIKTQPTDYIGAIGDTAKFTITATGVKYYQWQQNTGSGWVNINTSAGRSNSISITVAEFRVGYQYRCMISDGTTLIASDVVEIRLAGETLAITGQPEDCVGTIGGNATFTVTATGATSYQWYQNTGSGWVAINTTAGRSNTITIPVAAFRVGFQYRCEVSDGTTTITSDAATLLI